MPIYEYQCEDCQAQVEIFLRNFAERDTKEIACPRCHGHKLERLMSRVSLVNSLAPGPAGKSATKQSAIDQSDPEALARTMRRAGKNMGRDFNEVAGRLERGESPTSIETSMRKRVGEDKGAH
jgi:putative FmdB family regulatory protein